MGRNIQSWKINQRSKPNNKSIKFQQQPLKLTKQPEPFPRRQQFLLNVTKTKKEASNNKNHKAKKSTSKLLKFTSKFSRQNKLPKRTKTTARILRQYRRWDVWENRQKINKKENREIISFVSVIKGRIIEEIEGGWI